MAGGGVKINNIAITGGANGRTATFKIENGKLYNSYDSGVTWHELGQVAGSDGDDGQDGKGFNPRGEWQPNTTYVNDDEKIDIVQYDGSAYYCKNTHTGGNNPENDTIYWGLLVRGGVEKGVYSTVTIAANAWDANGNATVTIASLGNDDAIFFRPATRDDQSKCMVARIFVSPVTNGTSVSFSALANPEESITLYYYIARGRS